MAGSDLTNFKGDIWVGTSLGILKGVSISRKETLNFLPTGVSLSHTDKSRDILCMCWEHGGSKDQLYAGLRNGLVQCFDCNKNYFTAECKLTDGRGHFVGLAKHEKTLITCINEGTISLWPDGSDKTDISVGGSVDIMRASPDVSLLVATGGKENDMKLWDGNRPDAPPIFRAKNVPHDHLNLRVPIWVTSIGVAPGTGERPLVAVGTGHYQLRLYDTRSQHRPVYNHQWGEAPITCVHMSTSGLYYFAGNAHGQIVRVDLRQGKVVNHYHGFGGSVCDISSCSDDVFAACGLDRYLRVYNVKPPSVIYKAYMKMQCRSLLMNDMTSSEEQDGEGSSYKRERSDDEDDVWNAMDVVKTNQKKSKKTKHV